LRWELLDAFAQAAQEAGLPASTDFNTGNNEGVGYFEVNQRRGIRWNAAKAFLRPALGRPNLEVWTHSQVASLQLHRQPDHSLRCTGVRLLSGGGRPQAVTARRAVVLAAGAVGSAQLLQLSGIGSAQLLQQLGIQPELDLPGVGANLQDHLQIRAVFAVQGSRTLNTLSRSWWARLGMGLRYVLTQSGPLSMAPSQLGAFARSSPDQPWPNVQYHVQPLSLPAFGEPLDEQDAFTASVCHLNPSSRGTVRLASADPRQAPLIQPNYLSTSEDRAVAAQALRLTRRIAAQPALARFAPREVKPGMQFETDEDLARLAGEIGTTIFHPVGTCRMGREDDPLAVVGPRLKVRGVEGLHVADASVMPTITSGNTNAPTLMIAEQAARWLSSAA
jgi:choline dehydrogenase